MRSPNSTRVLFALTGVFFFSVTRVSAQDEWPPALKDAKDGTVTLKSDRFLDVPEGVAAVGKKDGTAAFTIAKVAPTVDFAFRRELGPNAITRRLWSSWGDICLAANGHVYVG